MRDAMNRLAGVLGRRRRWVLAIWVAIVIAALPFAARQTEHLTGGGFDVPGSQSLTVSEALQKDFGAKADGVMVALKAAPDSSRGDRAAAVGRVSREVATIDAVTLPPVAAAQGRRQLQRTGFALLPLRSDQSSDELIDSATTLREDLEPGTATAGVIPYLIGQPTIWAGMQEISKRDLARAEGTGFPIVALILLIVFGSLAAAEISAPNAVP
jgi:RND superfamily putative drug exporter